MQVIICYILPAYNNLEIMPGRTMRNKGKILRTPANTVPALAWVRFLAARALCTITCIR